MAVKIRMMRIGRRHRPFFRINAIESRNQRNGRVLEKLGHYDPIEKDKGKQVVLNLERVKHWLDVGAVPSDTVSQILLRHGIKTKHYEAVIQRRQRAKAIARATGKLFNKAERAAAAKAEADETTEAPKAEIAETTETPKAADTDKAKAETPKAAEADEAKAEAPKTADTDEAKAEAPKAPDTDKAKAETTEAAETTETDEAKAEAPKAAKTKASKTKADKAKADKAKPDKAKADKAKAETTEPAKSDTADEGDKAEAEG